MMNLILDFLFLGKIAVLDGCVEFWSFCVVELTGNLTFC